MRKVPFVVGQFYHVYNRGVDKRLIFTDSKDFERFIQSVEEFNTVEPIGSIYQNSFQQLRRPTSKLVNIVCYCVNPNHFHFILEEIVEGGISEFMKRLGGGYTRFFNEKNSRSGSLFQGRFKSVHVNSNEYLLHLSVYVNLNYKVHLINGEDLQFVRSSWDEYVGKGNYKKNPCVKNIILDQFNNKMEYKKFAEDGLKGILEHRYGVEGMEKLLLE